jgi:hypothetical protein
MVYPLTPFDGAAVAAVCQMEKDCTAQRQQRWYHEIRRTVTPDGKQWVFVVLRMREEFKFVVFNWDNYKRE